MTSRLLTIHGARGSMSVAGRDMTRTGGNTTCYSADLGEAEHLLIDAGTGLRRFEHGLGPASGVFHVFLTHFHWDHIQGLPLFGPLYDPDSTFIFHTGGHTAAEIEALLAAVIAPPWFPVAFAESASTKRYRSMDDGAVELDGIEVTACRGNHPQGVTVYRLKGRRTVVVATDHEGGDASVDGEIASLATGADVLLHDGQYTPAEYEASRRGWGHSTWRHAATAAKQAGASQLVLVSHDPNRDDAGIDAIVTAARREFAATSASFEGMTLEL